MNKNSPIVLLVMVVIFVTAFVGGNPSFPKLIAGLVFGILIYGGVSLYLRRKN